MIKRPPTLGRLAAMLTFGLGSFGALLFMWITFGGAVPLKPEGYRFHVAIPESTQLVTQADVRISGVPVGKVVRIERGGGGADAADVTIQMRARYAPITRDVRAMLRQKTLLGETYVELMPGSRGAPRLPDGGSLPRAAVEPTVQLDEILRTFDPRTRQAFRVWMQSQAAGMAGRGADVNAALGHLPGFVERFDALFQTLDSQRSAVRRMVSTTGSVFDAISEREGELRGLITDADRLFATTARRDRELAAIFEELPRFERESTRTLPQLTALARAGAPVVERLQPAARELTPTLAALEELAPQFRGLFRRLGPAVSASERGLPAFERLLARMPPLLDDFQPFLRNANPMVAHIGAHRSDLTAFFANATAASLARDLNLERTDTPVHYLRTSQTLSPEALAFVPRPLGASRQNAYPLPGQLGQLARGLSGLTAASCANGDPEQPASAIPESLLALVRQYVFRGSSRAVARPPCTAQGPAPGFGTSFPRLRAEP